MSTKYSKDNNESRGFTIVEMVVVIAIFGILAGLILFRYQDYQAMINLENTAQDIALEIQKAENDAIAGVYPRLGTGQTAPPINWRPSYGIYLDPKPNNQHQKQFLFFYDYESLQPSDPFYKVPGLDGRGYLSDLAPFSLCQVSNSECIRTVTITNDVSIVKTCEGSMADCTNAPAYGLGDISLVFTRPFPEMLAFKNAVGGQGTVFTSNQVHADVRIRLMSDSTGQMRDIVITPLGQIHIEAVQ